MLLEINSQNPESRKIDRVVEVLKSGGVIIIPTDTVYALACDIKNAKAIDKVSLIKGTKIEKANFSFLMNDLTALSFYTKPFDRHIFKMLNKALPGPYTFILEANNEVPAIFRSKKKTIGIRVPDNKITQALIEALGNPLMATSIHDDDSVKDYITDPFDVFEKYGTRIEMMIDGGISKNIASTVVDCTDNEIKIIREGLGSVDIIS